MDLFTVLIPGTRDKGAGEHRTPSKPSPKLSWVEGEKPGMGSDLESHINRRGGGGSVPTFPLSPTPQPTVSVPGK